MAWHYGTYTCGCEGRTQIYGPTKDRQRKAEWHFGHRFCPECWEVEKRRRYEAENAAAAEKASEVGLPELEGSEKQVAWANTLRQELWEDVTEMAPLIPEKDTVLRLFQEETRAAFWIDQRHYGFRGLILYAAGQKEKEVC